MIISPGAAKRVIIAVFVVPMLVYLFLYFFSRPVREHVPYVYKVEGTDSTVRSLPELSLQSLSGENIDADAFLGNICFVSFFSVENDTLTRVLHGNLKRTFSNLDWKRKPGIRFITINTGDSISDIKAYTEKQEDLDPEFWWTLTASDSMLHALAVESLALPEFERRGKGPYKFTSQYVSLIDKKGRLRKYFIGTDLSHERKMQEDIIALIRMEYPEELER